MTHSDMSATQVRCLQPSGTEMKYFIVTLYFAHENESIQLRTYALNEYAATERMRALYPHADSITVEYAS
jgi:hypothetical protein